MTLPIRRQDLVDSVARALQHISHTHPADFLAHLAEAHAREASPAARNAMTQILLNSRMAATDRRPICQDTGIVNVLLEVGMDARWSGFDDGLEDAVNEGVRLAYRHPDNPLRASLVSDPLFGRPNTRDNTPAVIHARVVPGDTLTVTVAAKGGGSENKARLAMLNPGDSVVDWVLRTVPELGAGWCPPGILGIGVGGTAEKAMQLAKESLMEPLDMLSLRAALRAGRVLTPEQALRVELHERVNALGIGAQGLGGLSTVLDVKLRTYPTHAAAKPVALIPNCAANRHARFTLDGHGPARFDAPPPAAWPDLAPAATDGRRVDLDTLTRDDIAQWRAGDTLLLNGRMLTGRDAAHRRIQDLLARGEPMPADFAGRVIYYVGPVDPVRGEAVGPAGPTTSTRMDDYTEMMLARGGLLAMVGKAERGPEAVAAIRRHRAAYLIAVGGAAYLVSQAIRSARVVAFEDLGMEAIYEFDVVDMPVTVAVDAQGGNVHEDGPARWRRAPAGAIGGIAIRGA
ncbi:fumarate hydratase [Achromobacter sp. AONIH1]|uniref:fumarate hydratase n=1 Tax=Achromobacter sp. AONIH1 TaxID=1758194 RepID=UPI000CD2B910|nr:fumarate hydratase [Achromobacter sp. AONIH1]AUT49082.1 fumarate hydratase [Achromobacter sp. AONIH1]